MIKDNRLHKIIEYLIKEDPTTKQIIKYDWKYEELTNAIKGATIYEVSEICKILISENIITPYLEGAEYDINISNENLRTAREAYYSGKFKKKIDFWNTSNLVLGIVNILILGYSVVEGNRINARVDKFQMDITTYDSLLKVKDIQIIKLSNAFDSLSNKLKTE